MLPVRVLFQKQTNKTVCMYFEGQTGHQPGGHKKHQKCSQTHIYLEKSTRACCTLCNDCNYHSCCLWRWEGLKEGGFGGLTEDKTGAAIRLLHTANFTFWTAYRERTLDFCSHDCRVEDAVRSALCSVRLCWSHAHDWLRPGKGKFKYTVVFTVKYTSLRGVNAIWVS